MILSPAQTSSSSVVGVLKRTFQRGSKLRRGSDFVAGKEVQLVVEAQQVRPQIIEPSLFRLSDI